MDSEEEEQEQEEAEGLVDMPWAVVAPGSPFDFRSLVVSLLDGALGGAASGFGPIDVEDPAEPAEEILPAASELVPCTRPAFKRLAPPRQLTPGAEPFPTDCLLSAPVASAAPTTPWNLAALARSLLSAEETAEEPAEATASAPSVMVPVPPQGERTVHRPRPHPGSLVAEGRERAAEVDMDSDKEDEEAKGLVEMPWATVAPSGPFDFRSLVVSLLDGALGGAASGFGPIDVEEPAEESLPAASELAPCTRPALKRLAPPRQLTPGAQPFPMDCLLSAPVASAAPATPSNLAALARSLLLSAEESAEETAEEPAEAPASAPSVMVPVPPQGERTAHRPRPHRSLVAEGRERAVGACVPVAPGTPRAVPVVPCTPRMVATSPRGRPQAARPAAAAAPGALKPVKPPAKMAAGFTVRIASPSPDGPPGGAGRASSLAGRFKALNGSAEKTVAREQRALVCLCMKLRAASVRPSSGLIPFQLTNSQPLGSLQGAGRRPIPLPRRWQQRRAPCGP